MSFNTFCNICFIKEHIIKLCAEENESILNILISFTSCPDIVNGIIYLCINCCNKLEEYNKFRELFLTNFVRFRYLYNEQRKQLETRNAPDIEIKLKTFIDINVERPNGTPLIENYEAAQALRNDTTCNVDVCKESDGEFSKIDFDESLNKNDLSHEDITFNSENNISGNEKQTCYVKYESDCFSEDQENINGSSIYVKGEPTSCDETYNELKNTDTVAKSVSCSSSTFNDTCNLLAKQRFFELQDTNLQEEEPNPDRFEESHDQLAIDTTANVIPIHESADDDIFDVATNLDNCETDDSTHEKGPTEQENKTTKTDAVCNVCDKRFSRNSDLKVHMRTHTGEKNYNCDECDKQFTHPSNFMRHKRVHSGERPYKCDECDKAFTHNSNLTEHKRIHSGERPYKCDECVLQFKSARGLNRHKLVHTGERPYSCDECHKTFLQSYKLIEHKRNHSGERPYKCDECGFQYKNSYDLTNHKRTHTGERPFSCDECQKTFTQIGNLISHKRIHSGDRPYKCDECGLGFKRSSNLKSHKRRHTGERPFACDECDKSFIQLSSLTIHKRGHSGEKPYKCDECDLAYSHCSNLMRHKRVHTDEKPFTCDECHKTFATRKYLTQHKHIHSGEKRYKCDECDLAFAHCTNLRRHKRTHIRLKP